jgi:thiol-disulfide isomerase/thioredoxin
MTPLFAAALVTLATDGWTIHTEAELNAALKSACETATAAEKPVLIGFSAPWCLDCKVLHKLEKEPEVAAELAHWEQVVTDVGKFDRHIPLMNEFGGDRIAWWVALQPTADQCSAPVTTWKRLRSGGIEPATGKNLQSAADLIGWLQTARGASASPADPQ